MGQARAFIYTESDEPIEAYDDRYRTVRVGHAPFS